MKDQIVQATNFLSHRAREKSKLTRRPSSERYISMDELSAIMTMLAKGEFEDFKNRIETTASNGVEIFSTYKGDSKEYKEFFDAETSNS